MRLFTASFLKDDEEGVVLVIAAAAMLFIFAIAALAVDIVNVHQERRRAQTTADAVVLAAAQDLPDYVAAVASAKEYAARNMGYTETDWAGCTDAGVLAVQHAPCISSNAAGTEFRVQLPRRTVSAFFAPVVGQDFFSVSANATAEKEFGSTSTPDDPSSGTPGDGDPNTPSVRNGDPGGGYPPCEVLPDWDAEPASGPSKKWTEFIFVFEHLDGTTTTVCGTSRAGNSGNNALVPEAGGPNAQIPTGIEIHVSCSDIFVNGWTDSNRFTPPNGPLQGIDTEWRVVRYTMDKYKSSVFEKRCGELFTPITSNPPTTGPDHIRLID